ISNHDYYLYLSIYNELQLELEELAEHHLTSLRRLAEEITERNEVTGDIDYTIIPEHLDTVLLAVQDPDNGDVLAMVGKQIDDEGEIVDYHYGTLTSTFRSEERRVGKECRYSSEITI